MDHNGSAVSSAPPNLARLELESIITALSYLPERTESDPERLAERAREKEIIKRRLETLTSENEEVRTALDAASNAEGSEMSLMETMRTLAVASDSKATLWCCRGLFAPLLEVGGTTFVGHRPHGNRGR